MSIYDEIEDLEFDKNADNKFGIKSPIIWAYSKKTNGMYPVLYLRKPKHISEDFFNELINSLSIYYTRPRQ